MPNIQIDISTLDVDKKRKLVKEFTKTASEITGIPEQAFVVFINEHSRDNIGVGGELLSEKQ